MISGSQVVYFEFQAGKICKMSKVEELELELTRCISQVDHLRSQNDVLSLTLEDAKSTSEKMSIHLARHESNATALQLALAYSDQVIFGFFFTFRYIVFNSHLAFYYRL